MPLSLTQLHVCEALELGSTLADCVERGLCSLKSARRWDVQALREEYRATMTPPRMDIRQELDRLTRRPSRQWRPAFEGRGSRRNSWQLGSCSRPEWRWRTRLFAQMTLAWLSSGTFWLWCRSAAHFSIRGEHYLEG